MYINPIEFVNELEVPQNAMIVNLDASYWDSYYKDCTEPVRAVRTFYAKAGTSKIVMATVPDRNAGGFYRFICGAKSPQQACRVQINQAIIEGCKRDCIVMDADEVYKGRENEDIHLTPETWMVEARKFMGRLK